MVIIKFSFLNQKKDWVKGMKLYRDIPFEDIESKISYTEIFKEHNILFEKIVDIHQELNSSEEDSEELLNSLPQLYKSFYRINRKINTMQKNCLCQFYLFSREERGDDEFKCIHCGCTYKEI